MKRTLYKILVMLCLMFVACESETDVVGVSDYNLISFQDDNFNFELNQDGVSTKTITVYNSRTSSSDVTYNLEVLPLEFNGGSGSTIASDYYNVPSSVTIPANERSAQFDVTIIDNSFGSSDRLVLGFADEDFALNPHPISMPIVIVCPVNELVLDITFDSYAEETSWELYIDINTSPTLIASGSGYDDLDNESIIERICIEDGDFGFVIYDAFSDGICCGFGQGSYSLILNGDVIKEGGSFGASEVTTFSLP
ncbi:DUF1735 domain-containing protein [Winogradskyella sp.]|uniref:DUF1735 domain-containing protein n=1 Tax=Winogradskyella sp. TaxID=1883156 RepID=UPI00261D225F|nr:DUF1735 domain-containing protein [Winogradskyella sp.]